MDKVSKLSGMVAIGAAALGGTPDAASAILLFESNDAANNTFPGESVTMNVGDQILGVINNLDGRSDVDFYTINGLPPGGTATFSLLTGSAADDDDLQGAIYSDGSTTIGSPVIFKAPTLLTGPVSSSGSLVIGIRDDEVDAVISETYRIGLQSVQDNRVPEPATLVLLGAGLIGLEAVRRRKRG